VPTRLGGKRGKSAPEKKGCFWRFNVNPGTNRELVIYKDGTRDMFKGKNTVQGGCNKEALGGSGNCGERRGKSTDESFLLFKKAFSRKKGEKLQIVYLPPDHPKLARKRIVDKR